MYHPGPSCSKDRYICIQRITHYPEQVNLSKTYYVIQRIIIQWIINDIHPSNINFERLRINMANIQLRQILAYVVARPIIHNLSF